MEYKKTLEDEIDWKLIDQLHAATINFSSTSLELKKLFFVLVSIAVPSLIKLSEDKLDISLFITLYILTLTFWFLDSFTYFYQESLREKMNSLFIKIRERHNDIVIVSSGANNNLTIEPNRTSQNRLLRSIFNTSILLYLTLFILNSVAFFLFCYGLIE